VCAEEFALAEWAGVKELIRKLGKRSGTNANALRRFGKLCLAGRHRSFPSTSKTLIRSKIHEPHVITVTGKAFYDIGHAPADHSNRRTTPKDYAVWEIHPVMKLEVVQ
jgi:hypothetical protein